MNLDEMLEEFRNTMSSYDKLTYLVYMLFEEIIKQLREKEE